MGGFFSRGPSLDSYLEGKVVWITGASSGLGRSLAIECARRGAKVVLSARNEAKLHAVKQECIAAGGHADSILVQPLDVAKFREFNGFNDIAATVVQSVGGALDIMVQNAGVSTRSTAQETSIDVDINVLNVNFLGPVALTKAVLPYLKKSSSARIIVVNSVQGKIGLGCRTSYSASKHALTGYFDSLRAELSVDGIGVTAVFPGYIKTQLSLNALTGDGNKYAKLDETTAKGADPTDLALKILRAAAAGKSEVVFAPLDAKAAIFLRNLLPSFVFDQLARKARKAITGAQKLPPGSSKED